MKLSTQILSNNIIDMTTINFEDDVKINIDKRGKIIKNKTVTEEYDLDGRLIKSYVLNDKNEYNGQYYQKTFLDGEIIFLLKTTYMEGKLHGVYEIYKYKNNVLYYSERSMYLNGLLEGSELIKQTFSKQLYSSFYFYKAGLKHGPFRLIINSETTEGNYKNGKLDGFIVTSNIDNTTSMRIFQDGNEL